MKLPIFSKSFEYENDFVLSCDSARIGKLIAQYELYKMSTDLPGAIVECGVFKGNSLCKFAMFRDLFGSRTSKKIIGFDIFGKFPQTKFAADKKSRKKFIVEAGLEGISKDQLIEVLERKNANAFVDLVKGDITKTVPRYVKEHPELRISLLNIDVDIYEPAVTILKYLYPRVVPGGLVLLDDYGVFPGETKAVEEYFISQKIEIKKFPYSMTPSYIVKPKEIKRK